MRTANICLGRVEVKSRDAVWLKAAAPICNWADLGRVVVSKEVAIGGYRNGLGGQGTLGMCSKS